MGSSASKKTTEVQKVRAIVALSPSHSGHSSEHSSAARSSATSKSLSSRSEAEKKMTSQTTAAKGGENSSCAGTQGNRSKKKWQTASVQEDNGSDWWCHIDELCEDTVPAIEPVKERKTWKTVRLFISSTFKDMSSEREYLVKTVIPGLRQWCESRKLRLVECDLRWGVPKDAETNDTIMACMSELDRCREENELPYVLAMMSERYGFVPSADEVDETIKAKYKWQSGMSVTSLEEMIGSYWDLNPKVLYLMRDSSFLSNVTDSAIRAAYEETDQKAIESLSVLKGKIREKFPNQVHDYTVQVTGIAENNRLEFAELDFGTTVFQHFSTVIEKQYPADFIHEPLSMVEIVRSSQYDFVEQRGQTVYGRHEQLQKAREYVAAPVENANLLLFGGYPGAGKSAVMAASVMEMLKVKTYKVFFHFVGATPASTNIYAVMARLHNECLPDGEGKMPVDQDEMLRYVPTLFQRSTENAIKEGYSHFVVFVDALNQLDPDGGVCKLQWLPRKLPINMRLILSSLEGECYDALMQHSEPPQMMLVSPLDNNLRTKIVEASLAEYNKRLDKEQMDILVNKDDAGRPLYLSVACEELRVFGEFRKLTKKISELPGDLSGLIEAVMHRVIEEYGGPLVEATVCLLEMSKFGLSESELINLLAVEPLLPRVAGNHPTSYEEKLPMMKWALVYLGLKQFLRPCGSSDEGLLDFYHRTVSKVVRSCYLEKDDDLAWYHSRLIAFFKCCTSVIRRVDELPYHYVALKDMEGLRNCLLQCDILEHLCQTGYRQQVMQYWQLLGGYKKASKYYIQFLEDLWKSNPQMQYTEEKGRLLTMKIVWLLIDLGQFNTALQMLEPMISVLQKKHGEMAQELTDPLHAIMTLLYRDSLSYVYNSHSGYQKCVRLGGQYVGLCEQVHRKYCDEDDNHLGLVFTSCGYFKSELLPESEHIFTKNSNQQGLAIVLYMQGEKHQYDPDMEKSISFFERSLKLCLASFGKVHMHTARCNQLYGQLFWNRGCSSPSGDGRIFIEKCLPHYEKELAILEEIMGPNHPTTVRSREDVIIVLQTLHRNDEADVLQRVQPENNTVE